MDTRHRIVVLSGPDLVHRHTCATLIRAGLRVTGICVASQETAGLPLKYIWHSARRRGIARTAGQIAGRIWYRLRQGRRDREIFERLYDHHAIEETLSAWRGEWHRTRSYGAPETIAWLEALEPDAFVVHSGYWVGKRVREIPRRGIVLGGHPGLTPRYRGSHSAFWAIAAGRPEDVGWSVFWLDGGVDSGDLVCQERLEIEQGDSYFTLAWKGMIEEARAQARVLRDLDRGIPIPRRPHAEIPEGSEYHVPTLREYLRYRGVQDQVR